MKTLSIKQPWASLIAHGIKDVENRSWRTKFRGRIYIHASAYKANQGAPIPLTFGHYDLLKELNGDLADELCDGTLVRSAIIGEVDVVDCVINYDSIWAEHMAFDVCPDTGIHILRKGQPYIWNWVLANPILYDKPIQNVKGALSFWEYEKPYEVVGSAEMVTI